VLEDPVLDAVIVDVVALEQQVAAAAPGE